MQPFTALAPRLPEGAKIVIFPGMFNPEHAIAGGWRRRKGFSLWKNIKAAAAQDTLAARLGVLRQYCKSTGWVADHWRE